LHHERENTKEVMIYWMLLCSYEKKEKTRKRKKDYTPSLFARGGNGENAVVLATKGRQGNARHWPPYNPSEWKDNIRKKPETETLTFKDAPWGNKKWERESGAL